MGKLTRGLLAVSLIITLGFLYSGEVQAQKKVRFAYPSSADMGDIPSLLAWEQLKKQVTEALVKWMAQHYKITPTWMIIPGSDVRSEALMRGQLDATPAEIGDVLNILTAKPGQFHVLISYAKTFPQLIGSMYFASADYVQKNSAIVESVLEAILRAHRNAEERPASVRENALRLLPETKPELVEATAATYKELRIWDVNGGAGRERGEASIKFFEESGLLKKDAVSVKQAFDTAPLDKVVKKLGRK